MTEAAPEATSAQEQPAEDGAATTEQTPKSDETDWKAEARKWELRAKENGAKAREFEKQQQASMTEAERAVAEAEARGRTAAAQDYGKRLATSEIRAEAATAGASLDGVFDYLDLGRFVSEDGEPDSKAIKAFVAGLPKKDAPPPPSFDAGSRGTASGGDGDMNKLIRAGFGRG